MKLVRERAKIVSMREDLLNRAVNEGFSGGEKKRNEIFQMAILEPKLAILDETDSGLDIDALRTVAEGVNTLRSEETNACYIRSMSSPTAASSSPVIAIWPCNWKNAATTGSARRPTRHE